MTRTGGLGTWAAALVAAILCAACAGVDSPTEEGPAPSVVVGVPLEEPQSTPDPQPPRVERVIERPVAGTPAAKAPRRAPVKAPPAIQVEPGQSASAINAALDWLTAVQKPDGSWDSGESSAMYSPGATGLAVLAFLGNGETPNSGTHKDSVKKGLDYLRSQQDAEGCIGSRHSQHFIYNHGYAALALTEAYGMTNSPLYRKDAQRAVDFVQFARNPYSGWRYGVRTGESDTAVTGLMIMVLKSGRLAGLQVDDQAFQGALKWVDKMTAPENGRVGYHMRGGMTARTKEAMDRFPAEHSEAMTAVGMLTRFFVGQKTASHELLRKGADLLLRRPPVWDTAAGSNDFYYWYWGTLSMAHVGGEQWRAWKGALQTAVLPNQRGPEAGDLAGSWDSVDAWSGEGGRVYSTAILCLAVEASERSIR